MANTQYYIYAAIAFVVYYIVNTYLTWKRLSHIPGPRWAAFSRWSMYRGQMAGENHQRLYKLSQDYGKLVRIGPNNLMTADAELFKRMNAVRSPYRRGGWYSAMRMKPGADNILSAKSEEHHDRLRQKMFNGYHGKENPHIEEHIDTRIADWINLIERKYITQGTNLKAMDFARKTQFLTLDVISDVAFNAPFYDLRDDNDNFGYLETTEMVLPGIMFMTIFPGIYEWMEKLYVMDLLAPSAKDKAGLGKVIGIAAEVVKKRFSPEEQKKEHLDMLGSFVRHGLTQEEAESECVFQILAGSDTTATAIRAIMLNLLTNPPVLKKLIDEIDAGIRSGDISSPIKDAEGKELKYLQAIIKEGLRVFPPVTGLIEKCSPPEGDHWNGVFIPGGTAVGYCALGVHRNRDIFGADADIFRPDRWIEAEGVQLKKMEDNNLLIFGYGRFGCLGKSVAFIELNKVFVELFRRYQLTLCNPEKPWDSFCVGIFTQKDMWVRVARREDSPDLAEKSMV